MDTERPTDLRHAVGAGAPPTLGRPTTIHRLVTDGLGYVGHRYDGGVHLHHPALVVDTPAVCDVDITATVRAEGYGAWTFDVEAPLHRQPWCETTFDRVVDLRRCGRNIDGRIRIGMVTPWLAALYVHTVWVDFAHFDLQRFDHSSDAPVSSYITAIDAWMRALAATP